MATDYVLNVSSYEGFVPGARHYYGRVKGPPPKSCHGGTVFNAPESRGKWTCAEGHEMPARVEWDVEEFWTEGRYERWAAKQFEGDRPSAFRAELDLLVCAARRFTGYVPPERTGEAWWEGKVDPARPGDRLLYGTLPYEESDRVRWSDQTSLPPWGAVLAVIE